jgi:prepilin-type N-terminal cleavage/methylation domain-containing protein
MDARADGGRNEKRHAEDAFTLVELLVVIAIVGILASLLLPALIGGKERAKRVACKNSIRQFSIAVHAYAHDHEDEVPSGASNKPDDDHLPVISNTTSNILMEYCESRRIVHCPSYGDWFITQQAQRPFEEREYGCVIGYNYHGGHTNTPWPALSGQTGTWISPMRLADDPSLVLISDMNDWSPDYGQTFAPHGKNGPILNGGPNNPTTGSVTPTSAEVGAAGGNVGLLDGSVSWVPVTKMHIYPGSRQWGTSGCWAMW